MTILGAFVLSAVLAATTPPATPQIQQPLFPTIAADQHRPSPNELQLIRERLWNGPSPANRLNDFGCTQYYTCYSFDDCDYSGAPNNGCEIDGGICNLCQVCCENCSCVAPRVGSGS
jgi:hypothetical protein